jgi:glycosyltransferase involved in cell wall biosynthesis
VKPDPRFSIIVTSYNQREFIADAVNSALAFPSVNYEVIVVDDGSTDGSRDILRHYGDLIRLVTLSTNVGRGAARNRGAELATGDYLVFLDGDDLFLPWALDVYERVAEAGNPQLILVPMTWFEGPVRAVSPSDRPTTIELVQYDDYLRKDRSFGVSASSVVIYRPAFARVAGWTNRPVLEDQELLIRLGTAGRTVHVLSPPTIRHRKHAGQTVWNIPPFLEALGELIRREGAGDFPGGSRRKIERLAILGALGYFWSKRAFKARLYWPAVKLVANTWPLQSVAVLRRLCTNIIGRRRSEELVL